MPVVLVEDLGFCGIKQGRLSCCSAIDDAALRDEFQAMNIVVEADAACTKATLCARCDPAASTSLPPPPCAPTTPSPPSPTPASASHAAADPPVYLDRIATGNFVHMVAHPDGSSRVFLSTRDGKIWLASLHDSTLTVGGGDDAPPFLDLTDRVLHDSSALGFKGVAFHPQFATNGRFFVAYNCDTNSPACGAGTCSVCAPEQGCDPQELAAASNGYRPCRYQLVVAEFSAKGSQQAGARANSSEVRRLFTMGLPQQPHSSFEQHDGQILFRSGDSNLYLITGNGGDKAQGQFDFSEIKRSFLGKIIRFDVEGMTAGVVGKPEIIATGLGNPRGCGYDSERPSYFFCAGFDQKQHEQVYLISDYNGNSVAKAAVSPAAGGRPSIIGGLVYRGFTDPILKEKYLYMYGSALWTGVEEPAGSGRFTSGRISSIVCSRNTPLPCNEGIGDRVLSFGEDNTKDAFILATDGVYHARKKIPV